TLRWCPSARLSRATSGGIPTTNPWCIPTTVTLLKVSRVRGRTGESYYMEEQMDKPRIFLGSSGKQEKLLQTLARGLEDVAYVEPWTTSFNPGTTTLERLLELTHEVDFATFVFARDDWTSTSPSASPPPESAQASPRDNVVFEAGLFGGAL